MTRIYVQFRFNQRFLFLVLVQIFNNIKLKTFALLLQTYFL